MLRGEELRDDDRRAVEPVEVDLRARVVFLAAVDFVVFFVARERVRVEVFLAAERDDARRVVFVSLDSSSPLELLRRVRLVRVVFAGSPSSRLALRRVRRVRVDGLGSGRRPRSVTRGGRSCAPACG